MVGLRILGLDYGEKRIGVAISDPLGVTAQPVTVIEKKDSFEQDLAEINQIIDRYPSVKEIVVGLPKSMNGEIGIQAQKTLDFVKALESSLKIKITTWDERLTTVEAERMLISAGLSRQKRKKVIDKSAAALILQNYLDSKQT